MSFVSGVDSVINPVKRHGLLPSAIIELVAAGVPPAAAWPRPPARPPRRARWPTAPAGSAPGCTPTCSSSAATRPPTSPPSATPAWSSPAAGSPTRPRPPAHRRPQQATGNTKGNRRSSMPSAPHLRRHAPGESARRRMIHETAPVRRFVAMLGAPAMSFLRPPSGRRRGRPEGDNRDLMRVDDLRVLSLFDGLTDEQLAELAEAGAGDPHRTRRRPVPRGRARRLLVDDHRWRHRPRPPCWPRGRRCREDGRTGSLGGRFQGVGRARRLPRHREEGVPLGGCSGYRPMCCVSGPTPGSRSPHTSFEGSTARRAPSKRPRGSASPW